MFAPKFEPGVDASTYPYPEQSDDWSYQRGATEGTTTSLFSPGQLPVLAALATNFTVFNKFFSSCPAPSMPHHMFSQSATSCGAVNNVPYTECNGVSPTVDDPEGPLGVQWPFVAGRPFALYPQRTIYDNLHANNISFKVYSNSTIGHYADLEMGRLLYYRKHFVGSHEFFRDVRSGDLPSFSWVMPANFDDNVMGAPSDDHPCHDMAKGEQFYKDTFEALRASPAWNETMWLLVFDDDGGVYDHMVPPHEGVPPPDAECNLNDGNVGCPEPFDFRRLGLRVGAIVASPWIPPGVVQEPTGPTNTSQWEHSSIPATVKELFGLPEFLTQRDAWAGSLTELLTNDEPSTQGPVHLPDAPAPATEQPPLDVTRRQARALDLMRRLREGPMPDLADLTYQTAHELLAQQWQEVVTKPDGAVG